jgi:hypothetical protein
MSMTNSIQAVANLRLAGAGSAPYSFRADRREGRRGRDVHPFSGITGCRERASYRTNLEQEGHRGSAGLPTGHQKKPHRFADPFGEGEGRAGTKRRRSGIFFLVSCGCFSLHAARPRSQGEQKERV